MRHTHLLIGCGVAVRLIAADSLEAQAAAPATASSAVMPAPNAEARVLGLSQIWQEVNRSFVFRPRLTFNVDSAYQASLTRVLATRDMYDYVRELQRFTALLHDGHSGVSFPNAMFRERTYPWVQTRWADGHLVVFNVGKALVHRLPVGTEITAINAQPVPAYFATDVLPFTPSSTDHWRWAWGAREALYGRAGDSLRIQFERPDGTRGDTVLARDRRTRTDDWSVPADDARLRMRWLRDSIAYVKLATFSNDSITLDFERLLPQLRRARGLILDVRGNTGGNSGNGWDILAHMVRDSLPLQVWRTRISNAAFRSWNRPGYAQDTVFTAFEGEKYPPYPDPLLVPTVILQDHETFSAAEDFLVAADAIPRILTMGQASGGSTGNPIFWQLPGGAFARIVSKHDRYADGREFVGLGVKPRRELPPITLGDLRAGRDPMLDAAMREVVKQPRG